MGHAVRHLCNAILDQCSPLLVISIGNVLADMITTIENTFVTFVHQSAIFVEVVSGVYICNGFITTSSYGRIGAWLHTSISIWSQNYDDPGGCCNSGTTTISRSNHFYFFYSLYYCREVKPRVFIHHLKATRTTSSETTTVTLCGSFMTNRGFKFGASHRPSSPSRWTILNKCFERSCQLSGRSFIGTPTWAITTQPKWSAHSHPTFCHPSRICDKPDWTLFWCLFN